MVYSGLEPSLSGFKKSGVTLSSVTSHCYHQLATYACKCKILYVELENLACALLAHINSF
jgi:hypothetical protein